MCWNEHQCGGCITKMESLGGIVHLYTPVSHVKQEAQGFMAIQQHVFYKFPDLEEAAPQKVLWFPFPQLAFAPIVMPVQVPAVFPSLPVSVVNYQLALASEPQNKKGRFKKSEEERPKWLPDEWTVDTRLRTRGKTAGVVDKYYYNPKGRLFRSKKEVLYYLEHNKKKPSTQKPKKMKPDAMASESSASSSIEFTYLGPEVNVTAAKGMDGIFENMTQGIRKQTSLPFYEFL